MKKIIVLAIALLLISACEDPTTVADTCNGILWYEAATPEDVTCIEVPPVKGLSDE